MVVVRVHEVTADSLGAELGLEPGMELLSVDGRKLEDFLDWEFLTAEERFLLLVRAPDGTEIEYDVERPEGLPMGVRLEAPRIRRCANHCDFCFVDGNPEGLRTGLFIRDDDYRLSFRYGNFATLTNLKPWDEQRIVEYRLSPLYVSVHATDLMVRRWLLRNPEAPDIMAQLRTFGARGIRFHAQVVLVPGVNDGTQLVRTLDDLYALGETVLSVSVVPVALTEFSKHHLVRAPSRDDCRAALEAVALGATRAMEERGTPWCVGADELYMRAAEPLPPAEWYGDFEQRENGVGSVRYLQRRIEERAHELPDLRGTRVGVVTGAAMGPLLPQVLERLEERTGARFELLIVTNTVFGSSVTTAGLLPGAAVRHVLAARTDLSLALLPAEAVNDDLLFIDDVSAEELAARAPMPVRLSYDFVDALSECGMRNAECGTGSANSALRTPNSAFEEGKQG